MYANLNYLAETFPEHRICFVIKSSCKLNTEMVSSQVQIRAFDDSSINPVKLEFSQTLRPELWSTSINRLFALEVLHREFPYEPLLHIESDVWISRHFPFNSFIGNNIEIAYPIVNESLAIASTLYFSSHLHTKCLADYVIESFGKGGRKTDMQLLADFARSHSNVTLLPSFPIGIPLNHEGLLVASSKKSYSMFEGIFDGATVGMFLTGIDPIHHFGFRKMFSMPSDHLFDGHLLDFCLRDKDLLELSFGETSYPVYSLHIQSKDLRIFQNSKRGRRLQKILTKLEKASGGVSYEFDPKSLEGNLSHFIKGIAFKLYEHLRRR